MDLSAIFLELLNMSFTGGCAIGIIFLVRLLLKKLPKKYLCILWAVVLVRLLTPFTIPTFYAGQPDIQKPIPENIMLDAVPAIDSGIEMIDNIVNPILTENFSPEHEAFVTSANPLQIVMEIAGYVWGLGLIIMLVYTGGNLWRFYRQLREAVPERKLDKNEKIYRCKIATPVVTGILKPRIYLPFDLNEPELSHVLVHERMHVKRKDHWLKLLFYIAVIIHWFNPLVWLAYRLLERDMEMACDEAVLEKMGIEVKTEYCESLLNLAVSKNHFVGNPVAFGESDVKRRIKNLLNYKKPYLWVTIVAVIVIAAVAVICLSSPVEEKGSEKEIIANAFQEETTAPVEAETSEVQQVVEALETEDNIFTRFREIDWEEVKADPKRFGDSGWEEGVVLLAEFPEDELYVYGYNDEDYQYQGIIYEQRGERGIRNIAYTTSQHQEPEIYWSSEKRLLQMALPVYTGNGVNAEALYVFEATESGYMAGGAPFVLENYRGLLTIRMDYIFENEVLTLIDTKYDKELFQVDLSEMLDHAEAETRNRNVTGISIGYMVDFVLGDEIVMYVIPGYKLEGMEENIYYEHMPMLKTSITYELSDMNTGGTYEIGEFSVIWPDESNQIQ